jgi:hypothetical protein
MQPMPATFHELGQASKATDSAFPVASSVFTQEYQESSGLRKALSHVQPVCSVKQLYTFRFFRHAPYLIRSETKDF